MCPSINVSRVLKVQAKVKGNGTIHPSHDLSLNLNLELDFPMARFI